MQERYTVKQTQIVKGLAACLMLFHHLFYFYIYLPEETGRHLGELSFRGVPLLVYLAVVSKVCVAIFLVLSGYGMFESNKKKKDTLKTSWFHLWKIYSLYWIVFIIFTTVSNFFFNRKFTDVYESVGDIVCDVFGVSKIFHTNTYNSTWWFMSIILVCYLLLPLFLILVKKTPVIIGILTFVLMFLPDRWFNYSEINIWIFPFIVGMILSRFDLLNILGSKLKGKRYIYIGIVSIVFIGFISIIRPMDKFYLDAFLALGIIVFCFTVLSKIPLINKGLSFIGTYSAAFFLIHTFVYEVFIPEYRDIFVYPIIIYIVIFSISLILSFLVSKLWGLLLKVGGEKERVSAI